MIPIVQVQKALYGALSQAYKVYELKKQNPTFPFIEIGQIIEFDDSIKTHNRHQFNVTIHTFSKGSSSLQSKELNNYVKVQLMDLSQVEGFQMEYVKLSNSTTILEPSQDGKSIFHGILRFDISIVSPKQI